MKDDTTLPTIIKGKYLHNKSGHIYEIVGVALQTETNEPLVIYRPLINDKNELFARPYKMFMETVELHKVRMPRFEKIED